MLHGDRHRQIERQNETGRRREGDILSDSCKAAAAATCNNTHKNTDDADYEYLFIFLRSSVFSSLPLSLYVCVSLTVRVVDSLCILVVPGGN